MNNTVVAEEVLLLTEEETIIEEKDTLEYPCMVIQGVMLEEEIDYLQNKKVTDGASLPLYVDFEGEVRKIGEFDLDLDGILSLKMLDYKLVLCINSESKKEIKGAESYLKFIRL